MKRPTSATARKWQSYNLRRSKNLALDRARRLANAKAKKQAFIDGHTIPDIKLPRKPPAFASITIRWADGTRSNFKVHQGPWGLSPSVTNAGRKLGLLLTAKHVTP